jgi:AcrR family transcriptional regulator
VSSATEPDGNGSAGDLEPPRPPGRPRDPDLEARVQRAALELFGQVGWSGLTMDGIASRARVGKSALYLRWADKGEILVAALRGVQRDALGVPDDDEAPDAGATATTVRDYLVRHALRRANLYLGEYGLAMLRLHTDVWASPEILGTVRERAITRFVLDERERVAAAIRRGEFAPGASAVRVLDAVEGAVLMHMLVTPPDLLPRVRAGIQEYVELMVDDQLRAAGYRGPVAAPTDDGPPTPVRSTGT